MKNTLTFLLLMMISIGFGLQSCEKKTEKFIEEASVKHLTLTNCI